MTLQYNSEFENNSRISYLNFVGYITPEGEPLDYSYPFGLGGHNRNCVTDFFMTYYYYDIYENYGRNIEINSKNVCLTGDEYKKAFRDRCMNMLPKECQQILYRLKNGWHTSKEDILKLRLANLFINCYQNGDFNLAFGRKLTLMDMLTFTDSCYVSPDSYYDEFELYDIYFSSMMLNDLKDTLVQYLGYDSVESQLPKYITTSCINVNERFYNYKLMDFRIFQIPKMIYDPSDMIYKHMPVIYQTEKEEILEKEIESIKKMVKLEDRYKYFR